MTKAVRLRIGIFVVLAGGLTLVSVAVHRHRQADRATLARLRAELAAATLQREVAEVALIEFDEGLRSWGHSEGPPPPRIPNQEQIALDLRSKIGSRTREEAARRAEVDGFVAAHRWL